MKEADKQEMLAIGKRTVDMFRSQLYDDKTGLFALSTNLRAFAAEDATRNALNLNPDLANITVLNDALKSLGLNGFMDEQISTAMTGALGNDILKAPEFHIAGALLVGEKNLNEYVQAAWDSKGDGKKVLETFKLLRNAVTSEETATKAKAQAAAVLFNPENSEYLSQGMVDGALATKIYNELTTGDMIQTMSAMKGTDMVTWDNYYNWVFDPGFKAVFQYELNSVIPNADKVNLKFDSQTMTFSSTSPGTTVSRKVELQGEKAYAENFTKRMNIWIKKVTPILESNGDDIVFELNRIFEANGMTEPKEGSDTSKMSFMQKAYSAMKREQEKKLKEEAATTIPQ